MFTGKDCFIIPGDMENWHSLSHPRDFMFKQEPKLCSNHDHSRCLGRDFNKKGLVSWYSPESGATGSVK